MEGGDPRTGAEVGELQKQASGPWWVARWGAQLTSKLRRQLSPSGWPMTLRGPGVLFTTRQESGGASGRGTLKGSTLGRPPGTAHGTSTRSGQQVGGRSDLSLTPSKGAAVPTPRLGARERGSAAGWRQAGGPGPPAGEGLSRDARRTSGLPWGQGGSRLVSWPSGQRIRRPAPIPPVA